MLHLSQRRTDAVSLAYTSTPRCGTSRIQTSANISKSTCGAPTAMPRSTAAQWHGAPSVANSADGGALRDQLRRLDRGDPALPVVRRQALGSADKLKVFGEQCPADHDLDGCKAGDLADRRTQPLCALGKILSSPLGRSAAEQVMSGDPADAGSLTTRCGRCRSPAGTLNSSRSGTGHLRRPEDCRDGCTRLVVEDEEAGTWRRDLTRRACGRQVRS